MKKSLREYTDELRRLGYQVIDVTKSKHCHIRTRTPAGAEVVFSVGATPSDRRATKNFTATARKKLG